MGKWTCVVLGDTCKSALGRCSEVYGLHVTYMDVDADMAD